MVRRSNSSQDDQDYFGFENSSQEVEKEEKPKKTKKESKPKTKKNKVIKKSSSKEKESEQKLPNIKKHEENEEIFFHEDLDQIPNPNNSLQLQNQDDQNESHQQSNHSLQTDRIHISGEEIFENITMKFMVFFNSIEQPNGLVFKGQLRKKLKKKYFGKIKFTDEHHLDPQSLEISKIKKQVPKNLLIFQKENHYVNMTDEQFGSYIKEDVEKIIQIFKQACYIFCQQVTPELYNILRKLCNIVVQYRNQVDRDLMISKLREFGDKIASQNDDNHKYQFFGFQFEKFPEGKSDEQLKELEKKEKYKFVLKNKYRRPGGQFAKFTTNIGLYLQGALKELKCYKSLV